MNMDPMKWARTALCCVHRTEVAAYCLPECCSTPSRLPGGARGLVRTLSVVVVLVTTQGCAASFFVAGIGKTEAVLRGQDALVDDTGTVCVEADLFRMPVLGDYREGGKPLGRRYVILNAPGFEERVAREMYTQVSLSGYPSSSTEMSKASGWLLHPPNVVESLSDVELPPYLRTRHWSRYPVSHRSPLSVLYTIPWREGHSVTLSFWEGPLHKLPDSEQQSILGRCAMVVLFLPAVVIDIVTFPIQFYALMKAME